MRFAPAAGETAQDWSFQRAASAVTKTEAASALEHCPNCGAPFSLTDAGSCTYCHAPISSGQYDWILARIQAAPATPTSTRSRVAVPVLVAAVAVPVLLLALVAFFVFRSLASKAPTATTAGNGTSYTGTLTLSGAVTADGLQQSGTETQQPNCQALATASTGFTSDLQLSDGGTLSVKVSHPEGPGKWDQSQVSVVIDLNPPPGGPQAAAQHWEKGPSTHIAQQLRSDGQDALTFENLEPKTTGNENLSPLSGTYTETCRSR